MASSIQLNSTNNSEMKIEYQGTSGVPKTVVVPDRDMTVGSEITLGTAVTASGTSVDFTGIPSGVKRVTVMFNGVSTIGTSLIQVQLGAGSISTSGYTSSAVNATANATSTTGFLLTQNTAATYAVSGIMTIANMSGNIWTYNSSVYNNAGVNPSAGILTLSGTLDRIRVTTLNGTDTFDAGTINISWEF